MGPPSSTSVFNISSVVKLSDTSEVGGALRRGLLISMFGISPNTWCEPLLNEPGYRLSSSYTVKAKIRNIFVLAYIEDMQPTLSEQTKCEKP